jgi:hypothetical protein
LNPKKYKMTWHEGRLEFVPHHIGASMGVETALLFCAIRAAETLGTIAFSRDTRAGYETALCLKLDDLKLDELNYGLLTFCLTSPALVFDAVLDPVRFGSVASCNTAAFQKAPKARNKSQARLDPADQ